MKTARLWRTGAASLILLTILRLHPGDPSELNVKSLDGVGGKVTHEQKAVDGLWDTLEVPVGLPLPEFIWDDLLVRAADTFDSASLS